MGILSDILKEVPLSALLRERLAEEEKKVAELESENTVLKAELESLQAKKQNLCPYCGQFTGKLEDIKDDPVFVGFGNKVHYYKCSNAQCGKSYDRHLDA